jgi:hypothetical protein
MSKQIELIKKIQELANRGVGGEATNAQKPILFSSAMVQAILNGTKTQTRRIIKIKEGEKVEYDNSEFRKCFMIVGNGYIKALKCPYKVGDILWVKEIYYAYGKWIKNGISKKTGKQKWIFFDTTLNGFEYHYQNNPPENILLNTKRETYGWFKRSSLFMPYKASRIKLEITSIRIQKLNNISGEDAIAEGIERWTEERMKSKPTHYKVYFQNCKPEDLMSYTSDPIDSYETLWRKINGEKSWDKNPVIWCLTFERAYDIKKD